MKAILHTGVGNGSILNFTPLACKSAIAESKSSRNKRRKIEQSADGYPTINFLKARPERVELKALHLGAVDQRGVRRR